MENLTRRMAQMKDKQEGADLLKVLTDVYERIRTVTIDSAGLAISGAGGKTVKTGASACHATAQGVLQSIAASTALPALVGTVVHATFNVFVFSVDKAGNLYCQMGTAGASLAQVGFPLVPPTRAILGFAIINPTGTGNFVGGTTALDDATVVPNAVYVNVTGAFDPNATVI